MIWSVLSPPGRRAQLVILTFHRVFAQPDPLIRGEPDASRFTQILEWLSQSSRVLPLEEAIRRLDEGTLPARSVCITFDDGYLNNLEVAKPLLVAAGLPATVFIAVQPVRQGIMWNDLVIEALRYHRGVTDLSDLGLNGFEIAEETRWGDIEDVLGQLKYRPLEEREDVARELYRRLRGGQPERQMLTEEQIVRLQGDGISLGAHTVNHPILTRLPDEQARTEIVDSRNWLHDVTGKLPELFAYPNGRPDDDYDGRHVEMVREAGFLAAVSTQWSAAHARSPRFELPRFTPWEASQWGFTARIVKTCLSSYAG